MKYINLELVCKWGMQREACSGFSAYIDTYNFTNKIDEKCCTGNMELCQCTTGIWIYFKRKLLQSYVDLWWLWV